MKSIISNEKECNVCGYTRDIHKHHIFFNTANRKISERQGCWCYLCARHHNMSDEGIHFNKELDTKIKRLCQEKWEEINGTRDEFIRTFGKSYL